MRNSARRLLSAYRASRSGPEGGVAVQDGCTPPTAGLHGGSGRGLARQRPVQALSPGQYSDTAQRAQRIRCASLFVFIGIALSLLPCSLPMIPILSALIAGEGAALNRRRGLCLSLTYVLGMAAVYTALGIAA